MNLRDWRFVDATTGERLWAVCGPLYEMSVWRFVPSLSVPFKHNAHRYGR